MVSGECGCEARKGKCNHVIGLLHLSAHYKALGLETVPPPQPFHLGEVQDVTIQKGKIPPGPTKRTDGIRFTLYNPIPEVVGDLSVVENLRKGIEQFSSVQLHTVLPSSADITKVSCKFGGVSKGSMLSYQQKIRPSPHKH